MTWAALRRATPPVFIARDLRAFELDETDVAALQRFFEANPEYFVSVNGAPPGPQEAIDEYRSVLPHGWSFTKRWLFGFTDATDGAVGMANVVADMLAARVWHIGLFIVATQRHGSGDAHALYEAMEDWARGQGAEWIRLGVVTGNARAERFWEQHGFIDVRTRGGITMGKRVNTVRVMVKPLAGSDIGAYLSLVARDRPET
jgi:GNAT superfamily N-acetyltransferase